MKKNVIKKFRLPRKLKKIYKDPIRFARLLKSKGFTGYSYPVFPFVQRLNRMMNVGYQYENFLFKAYGF